MLHLHYKQVKDCRDTQKDQLSQEITILQAIKKVSEYLKCRDQGYMYFPDISFIPLIRQVDEVVKQVVNEEKMGDGGDIIKECKYIKLWLLNLNIFQAAHEKIKSYVTEF